MAVVPFPSPGTDTESSDFDSDLSNSGSSLGSTPLTLPSLSPSYEDITNDLTRVRLFAAQWKGRLYWSPASKSWYVWDDSLQRWKDEREPIFSDSFSEVVQTFLQELSEWADNQEAPLRAGPDSLLSARCWGALCRLSKHQSEFRFPPTGFDQDHRYLGVANGVIDLQTCKLLSPSPDFHISSHLDIPYTGPCNSSIWDDFLYSLTGPTKEDRLYRLWLRSHFGSILGGNLHERFTILHGPAGTGKSTLGNAIRHALGHCALTTNHDTFSRQRPGVIREDLASFSGKRLIVDMELPDSHRLDPSVIKMLSGRDQIRARKLYRGGTELSPTWSIVVACNQLPIFDPAPDSGFWRRVLVLPFTHQPRRPDPYLKDRLAHPRTRQAILAWLIDGLRDFHTQYPLPGIGSNSRLQASRQPGSVLPLPLRVQRSCAAWRLETDHVSYWLESFLTKDPHTTTLVSEVYLSYLDFCKQYQIPESLICSKEWLPRHISARLGISPGRTRNARVWHGIKVVDPDRVHLAAFDDRDEYEYGVRLSDFHI